MVEVLIKKYSTTAVAVMAGAIIFLGAAIPLAVMSLFEVAPRIATPAIALCIIPTSLYGIWLVTRAFDKRRHWRKTLSDVARALLVSVLAIAALVALGVYLSR